MWWLRNAFGGSSVTQSASTPCASGGASVSAASLTAGSTARRARAWPMISLRVASGTPLARVSSDSSVASRSPTLCMPSRSSAERARAVSSVAPNGDSRVSPTTAGAEPTGVTPDCGTCWKMARQASVISSTVSNRAVASRASARRKNPTNRSATSESNTDGSRVTSSLTAAGLALSPHRGSVPVAIS